eukprot:scaffold38146_cov44-Attheya_sp.AAC.2
MVGAASWDGTVGQKLVNDGGKIFIGDYGSSRSGSMLVIFVNQKHTSRVLTSSIHMKVENHHY